MMEATYKELRWVSSVPSTRTIVSVPKRMRKRWVDKNVREVEETVGCLEVREKEKLQIVLAYGLPP